MSLNDFIKKVLVENELDSNNADKIQEYIINYARTKATNGQYAMSDDDVRKMVVEWKPEAEVPKKEIKEVPKQEVKNESDKQLTLF